jgi:hypothetical protein
MNIFPTFLILSLTVVTHVNIANAFYNDFDLGGRYNPVYVEVQPTQQQENTTKELSLKSQYGISTFYDCDSKVNINTGGDPFLEAQRLSYIQYCLESAQMKKEFLETATCSQGYVRSGGKCVLPDNGCKSHYGQYSFFSHFDVSSGSPVCDCVNGYVWDTEGTHCIEEEKEIFSLEIQCLLRQGRKWNSNTETCDCLPGYFSNVYMGDCHPVDVEEDESKIFVDKNQVCMDEYGMYSIWSGEMDGNSVICGCVDNYEWSGNSTCIPKKTENQICMEGYGEHSFWSGELGENGEVICDCREGYLFSNEGDKLTCAPHKNIDTLSVRTQNGNNSDLDYSGNSSVGRSEGFWAKFWNGLRNFFSF